MQRLLCLLHAKMYMMHIMYMMLYVTIVFGFAECSRFRIPVSVPLVCAGVGSWIIAVASVSADGSLSPREVGGHGDGSTETSEVGDGRLVAGGISVGELAGGWVAGGMTAGEAGGEVDVIGIVVRPWVMASTSVMIGCNRCRGRCCCCNCCCCCC